MTAHSHAQRKPAHYADIRPAAQRPGPAGDAGLRRGPATHLPGTVLKSGPGGSVMRLMELSWRASREQAFGLRPSVGHGACLRSNGGHAGARRAHAAPGAGTPHALSHLRHNESLTDAYPQAAGEIAVIEAGLSALGQCLSGNRSS